MIATAYAGMTTTGNRHPEAIEIPSTRVPKCLAVFNRRR